MTDSTLANIALALLVAIPFGLMARHLAKLGEDE